MFREPVIPVSTNHHTGAVSKANKQINKQSPTQESITRHSALYHTFMPMKLSLAMTVWKILLIKQPSSSLHSK